MTSFILTSLLCLAGAWAAPESGSVGAFEARVTTALNEDNPWRASRLAEQWAAVPGIPKAERAEALIEDAQAHAQVGDYAGARAALLQALKARPGDPEASFLLAEATREDPERALPLAEAAAGAPGTPRRRAAAYRLAGEIRLDLGDSAGAREDWSRALALAPDDLLALERMASLAGPREEASRYAHAACAVADGQPAWRLAAAERVCARALSAIEDYSGAMCALGRALALDPDDADTLRAILKVKQLNPVERLPQGGLVIAEKPLSPDEARRELESEPDDLEALHTLFESARAAGRPSDAAALADQFTAAIRRSPHWQRLDAYRLSAEQWIEVNDTEKALASLELVEVLDTASVASEQLVARVLNHPIFAVSGAYEAAAELRLALGDPTQADATIERGLRFDPGDLDLLRYLIRRKLAEARPRDALPYAEQLVATAKKGLRPVSRDPQTQGLLNADAANRAEVQSAEKTLRTVRQAIARDVKESP